MIIAKTSKIMLNYIQNIIFNFNMISGQHNFIPKAEKRERERKRRRKRGGEGEEKKRENIL